MEKLSWGTYLTDTWALYRIYVPSDGSCLIHALLGSFYIPYIRSMREERIRDATHIVKSLRHELSVKLSAVNSGTMKTYYSELHDGYTSTFADSTYGEGREYTLRGMKELFDSDAWLGFGQMQHISNQLNKDIYVLDLVSKDIYNMGRSDMPSLYKDRESVILLYTYSHYELVAYETNGNYYAHFKHDNPLIQYLYERMVR